MDRVSHNFFRKKLGLAKTKTRARLKARLKCVLFFSVQPNAPFPNILAAHGPRKCRQAVWSPPFRRATDQAQPIRRPAKRECAISCSSIAMPEQIELGGVEHDGEGPCAWFPAL